MIRDFTSVHLVNLDRRPDRLKEFNERFAACGWPFKTPERFSAIDGNLHPVPVGYSQQPGAWGCLQSHLLLWEASMRRGEDSIFIFEDDCVFRPDFARNLKAFLKAVPADWDMIYLGGLHRFSKADQPKRITSNCYRAWGVTGTWAYAVRGRFIPILLRWFGQQSMYDTNHIDQMLCKFQIRTRPKVYIPYPWLCGMGGGVSDICGRDYSQTAWWDWKPGETPRPYEAVDRLGAVKFQRGRQVGRGEFRMGFDPKAVRMPKDVQAMLKAQGFNPCSGTR